MTADDSGVVDDVARMEGELDVALPEIRVQLASVDERLRAVELQAAALEAARRLPNWVPTVAACAGLAGVLLALMQATRRG